MGKMKHRKKSILRWGISMGLISIYLMSQSNETLVQANESRSSHIGLFNGETAFSLSSETGILPTLEIETKDVHGNVKLYESNLGKIVIPQNNKFIKKLLLKGETASNLKKEIDLEYQGVEDGDIVDDGKTIRFISNSTKGTNIKFYYPADISKTYTIKCTISNNTSSEVQLLAHTTHIDSSLSLGKISSNQTETINVSFKPVSASINQGIFFFLHQNAGRKEGEELVVENLIVLEGDYGNKDISYFSNSLSVQKPVITITNEDNSQIATITVEEDIILRSNGDIYDELDLMTGKFTQRINEDGTVLDEEVVRYIKINSTHTFEQNKNADVSVVGNITPILGSITVPSDPLSFTLNPNLEEGQQFVAPEFSVSNDNQAPIGLEVKSFEQTTTLLNDVLPNKYDSWEGLNKTQSKDIALSLEPQLSDGWLTLNEGSYYVANTSDIELGRVKGNSTVHFKFSALHGQSFTETLNPQYKLTFVFEL